MLSEIISAGLPSLWPFYQALYLIFSPANAFKAPMKLKEYTFEWSPSFLITYNFSIFVYALLSALSYKYTFPDMGKPIDWWYWAPVIVARDLFFTLMIYEPWHFLTYGASHYVNKLSAKKFNKAMPDQAQWKHDRFWSLSGTVIAALHELLLIYLWSNGYCTTYSDFWSFPLYSLGWAFFAIWWRHFHFFFAHRFIHPWFTKQSKWKQLDLGEFLYRHVHSLHHKSYNPGPWSGLSMHPVEHLVYYSCVFVPTVFIAQHPIHFMINKFHATVSPAPGHDGYDSPIGAGSGGYFHYLHHAHYECNYGTEIVPLDRLFGCFEDGSKYRCKNE